MKTMKYVCGLLLGLLLIVSCSKSTELANDPTQGQQWVIEASQEGYASESRTIRQEDGAVYWHPGDEISLFFMRGENGGDKFTSQNTEVAEIAEFAGTINGITGGGENLTEDAYFWAVYPYSAENICENNSVVTTLSNNQEGVEETFADDLFITIARSLGVKMGFKNVCGGIKFCVSQSGIKSVVFKGNNDEVLAGKVRVGFDANNTPAVSEIIDGKTEITLTAPNGGEFEVGKFYYIVALPKALEGGFTMTFHKTNGAYGVYTRTTAVTIKRSIFGTVRNLDEGLSFQGGENPGEEDEKPGDDIIVNGQSGFYLGIVGFNTALYTYPIHHLSDETLPGFYSFINGLSLTNGTLLYYAVDHSLDVLQKGTFPSNLYNVSVVTFTDGLDRGSLDKCETDKNILYLTNDEYLEVLHTRLTEEKVSRQDITAYSIGVRGKDVTNTTSFKNNLNKLATSSDKVFEVSEMAEVNTVFSDIANLLGETNHVQTFKLDIHGPSHLERCRFTFDNVTSATSSKQYIEGTFNRADKTLTNVTYVGLTSSSGTTVAGVKNESGFFRYTFEDLHSLDGELIPSQYVTHWYTEGGIWQKDTEFVFDPTRGIEKKKQTAAILLNIDCSSSLEGNFSTLQQITKSFIQKLLENSVDPNEVASISLNTTSLTLNMGEKATLNATVLPSTALLKDVVWSSSDTSVAVVSAGVVTALSPGEATITAKTVDGGFTASCQVNVKHPYPVTGISLPWTKFTLPIPYSTRLTANITPSNASDKRVEWTSSNTSVAVVDDEGRVFARSEGNATITAKTVDGGFTASCIVTAFKQLAEELTLNHTGATLYSGETIALQAAILPKTTTNTAVQWSSSNESVATVSQEGLVSALTAGTTTIAATTLDGSNLVAQCVITVKQYVTAITLSSSALELKLGQSHTLQATLEPSNATNTNFTVVSSNTTVATVHQDGEMIVVNGIGEGSATITVTTEDGGLTAECNVSVTSWPQTPSHLSLAVQKDGVRYFIPQADYSKATFAEYTKIGITLISESESFILALDDLSAVTLSHNNAVAFGTLPTKAQAEVITANWASVDTAIATFGGKMMGDKTYWSQTFSHQTSGRPGLGGTYIPGSFYYVCYNATEVSYSASSNLLYAREIIATL